MDILETALYVNDLAAAKAFYETILGLECMGYEPTRHVFFRCGKGILLIFHPPATAAEPGLVNGAIIPCHGAVGPGHLAFAMAEAEIDSCRKRLAEHNVEIESEVHWPNGGYSLYFRDPAGNSLEFATRRVWE